MITQLELPLRGIAEIELRSRLDKLGWEIEETTVTDFFLLEQDPDGNMDAFQLLFSNPHHWIDVLWVGDEFVVTGCDRAFNEFGVSLDLNK
ncbi:hypothetical protein SPB21_03685 [Leptothoe sp. ISB3NOV94-8A]